MAHMMRKMKDLMPPGSVPKELDVAIKRLEAGEDPEKIEEDMGDLLGDFMGGEEGGGGGGYAHDSGFFDFLWGGSGRVQPRGPITRKSNFPARVFLCREGKG